MKKVFIFLLALCGFAAVQADEINAVSATQGGKTDWFKFGDQNSIIVTLNTDGNPVFPDKTYSMIDGNVLVAFGTAPEDAAYTRDVANGSWETICLPWESTQLEGADFYNVLGTKDPTLGVALEPIDKLEAGYPYVFKATSDQIKVTYNPTTEVANPVDAGNHIIGSFAGCNVPEGMYILINDLLYRTSDASITVDANRAYFDFDNMEAYNPATAPAGVVFIGGHQTPTELKVRDAQCTMHEGKYLINGQFVIIKDNKMYNAQGIKIQ